MSFNAVLPTLLCILLACAPRIYPLGDRATTIEEAKPEPTMASQHPSEVRAVDTRDAVPHSMRVVAVADASDFALRPRFEDNEIVLPLPSQQARLADVDVNLLVFRRGNDEVVDQQRANFSWMIHGAELRFFLPRLSGGDYVAEIRTTRADGMTTAVEDRAQVSFQITGTTQSFEIQDFAYHFEIHHSLNDKVRLVPSDAPRQGADLGLNTALGNNKVLKITLDCWASSDGDSNYNRDVSKKRCQWVHDNILKPALGDSSIEIFEVAHGEDNPPNPEPVGISLQRLNDIRRQNRVVIVKVYTPD
jgi:hypothetical protein